MSKEDNTKQDERKVLPIVGIVFGAIALAISWVPIVNNIAAFFGVIGAILAIIAIFRNLHRKKTLTFVALALSIASFAIVLVTQSSYSKALDNATSEVDKSSSNEKTSSKKENKTFKVGDTVKYDDIEFKVNSFNFKPDDPDTSTLKDGNQLAIANVTITNKSNKTISYNPYDFKLDNNGNLTDFDEIDTDNDNSLDSGDLKPGASVTGDLIGQANPNDSLKLNYNGDMFTTDESFSVNLNK